MTDRYFEDFEVGDRFESPGVTVSEAQILDFALTYDPQPFHIDKPAAETGHFGGLISSGFQTLALSFRMAYQTGVFTACGMGSPGMQDLSWLQPVRPGDTLRTRFEIVSLRQSKSKPDRGFAEVEYEVVNQRGQVVMSYRATQIFACRPPRT